MSVWFHDVLLGVNGINQEFPSEPFWLKIANILSWLTTYKQQAGIDIRRSRNVPVE